MVSITTVIQYIYKCRYKYNTGGLCCFRYERFIHFLTSIHGVTMRGTQFLLCWPQPSVCRDSKSLTGAATVENFSFCYNGRNSTVWLHDPISTDSFQNHQILRTNSSEYDVIHTPPPFPFWVFIITMVIVISFARERKLHPMAMHLNSRDSNSSKPYQTK